MLAYILAIAVGFGSFAVYMAAFFFPEVHRKEDFLWSGVGLFYALVLWVCASRITGGVLLGQLAGVSLLGWFGWETIALRRAIAQPEDRTALEGSIISAFQKLFSQIIAPLRNKSQPKVLQTATIVTETEESAFSKKGEVTSTTQTATTAELEVEPIPAPETASTAELEGEPTPTTETASTVELEREPTPTPERSTAELEVEVTSKEAEVSAREKQEVIESDSESGEVTTESNDETESPQDKIT